MLIPDAFCLHVLSHAGAEPHGARLSRSASLGGGELDAGWRLFLLLQSTKEHRMICSSTI